MVAEVVFNALYSRQTSCARLRETTDDDVCDEEEIAFVCQLERSPLEIDLIEFA